MNRHSGWRPLPVDVHLAVVLDEELKYIVMLEQDLYNDSLVFAFVFW